MGFHDCLLILQCVCVCVHDVHYLFSYEYCGGTGGGGREDLSWKGSYPISKGLYETLVSNVILNVLHHHNIITQLSSSVLIIVCKHSCQLN